MSNQLLWFVLASVATYRCASIVSAEDGPFDVFLKLRDWSLANAVWFYKGLKCFACTSVWFGALFSIFIAQSIPEWMILTFAVSGLALLIYLIDFRLSK